MTTAVEAEATHEDADQLDPVEVLAQRELTAGGFPEQIIFELAKPLDLTRVKQKPGQGSFDYIPHADIRRTLNRIFGYGGWGYTTDNVTIVSQGPFVKDNREGVGAAAVATVTLRLRLADGSWLEKGGTGEGWGTGYGPTAPFEAPGKAAKEAESDALKRAAINLGDQFGLILYAKEERRQLQAEAEYNAPADEQARNAVIALATDKGKHEQTLELLMAEAAEHGHIRAGKLAAIKARLEELPDAGKEPEPAAELPAEEPPAAPPEPVAAAKPLPDGQAAVGDAAIQVVRLMAVKLGKKAEEWFDEQVEKAKAENDAQGYGRVVTQAWLDGATNFLSQKLAVAGDVDGDVRPAKPETEATAEDVAAAFEVDEQKAA